MALWSLLIAYCFGMVGYIMLTFISGIEKINTEFYDSAGLEGANIIQKFFYITLPLVKGVIRSNIVVWTVSLGTGIFAWNFMFSPNNLTLPTAVPPVYLYDLVFGGRANAVIPRDTGAGAAVGMMLALMVVAVSLVTTLITRHDDIEI
jgi:multiple sugar transport system permease protein